MAEALEHLTFEASSLMSTHPPQWIDGNKKAVFEISSPAGCEHGGTIDYTRWPALEMPGRVDVASAMKLLEPRPDVFDYEPALNDKGAMEWHVNFANQFLFLSYTTGAFAQDELQVAEHPVLGALRDALLAGGYRPLTEEDGKPTPVLVAGAERRCSIDAQPNPAAGRPSGIYGRAFHAADVETIRSATCVIEPATVSNVICIAAIACETGFYTRAQIEHTLSTAYSGFRAARLESDRLRGGSGPVAVHTGFWGCGAFGGNRVLMTLLQVVAAGMAGLDLLVFHTVREQEMSVVEEVRRLVEAELSDAGGLGTAEFLDRVTAMGFEWGVSDGN